MQQLIWPLVVGFLLSLAAGPVVLPILRRLKMGQSVRDDGPQTHLIKQGTPTIGGLIFLFGGLVSALLFTRQSYGFAVFSVLITLGFGAVGFLDDYIKVAKHRSLGLKAYQKIIGQFGLAVLVAVFAAHSPEIGTKLYIPFAGLVDFGGWYIPFVVFIVVGMVNSVNEVGDKCETIFPLISGTDWNVIGLTCDQGGIPYESQKKIDIAKRIIDKADHYGVALKNLHIDPCVMALATLPNAMEDFQTCIRGIHAYAPEVKVTGAISNISFNMPARKYINTNCMAYALEAGLDSAILDPCSIDMMSTIYACEALTCKDKSGRKYNRAYRQGKIGAPKK